MKITWFGHSSFLIQTSTGKRIITDPYTRLKGLSHSIICEKADIVTVSHDHWDHSSVEEVAGTPEIIKETGRHLLQGVAIEGFPSFHDPERGKLRGENIIFRIETDDYVIVHCGDIGELPPEDVTEKLRDCDILMVPVGGVFTIGPEEAALLTESVSPKAVIPMHYLSPKVPFLSFKATDFTSLFPMIRETAAGGFSVEEMLDSPVKPVVILPESAR